jgi:hypothetical protein
MASLAVMAGVHIKKMFNEMLGYYSDRPLSIPVDRFTISHGHSNITKRNKSNHTDSFMSDIASRMERPNFSRSKVPAILPTV